MITTGDFQPLQITVTIAEDGTMSGSIGDQAVLISGIPGWHKGGDVRRNNTAKLWTHGDVPEPSRRGGRLVTIAGDAWTTTRADAAALADQLAATLADGTLARLIVIDPDQGTRYADCFIASTPDIDWWQDTEISFSFDVICPDPRKYGDTVTDSTGVAVDGGGLAFDLFTGQPYNTIVKTNYILNPSAEYGTNDWVPVWGTLTRQNAFNSMQGRIGAYQFQLICNGGSPYQQGHTNSQPMKAGDWASFSARVWGDTATIVQERVELLFQDASGATTGYSYGALTSVVFYPGGTLSVTAQAPAGTTQVQAKITAKTTDNSNIASGYRMWWDAAILQQGPTQASVADTSYFDGDQPAPAGYVNQWTGTAGASTSTQSTIDGADGVLDFGETGDPGTVTFTNPGTAPTTTVYRVDGYAPGFTITETSTGRQLVYTGTVPTGQFVELNAKTGTVYLNGDPNADRSELLTVRQWTPTPGNGTSTYYFESAGTNARLTVEAAPAWW